jgi:aminoglycoside phosphotransferase (APT) family kinase protein
MSMSDESALFAGTMPVQDKHRFDQGALERFMQERIPGFSGPLEVEQFKGGQSNPTYRLTSDGPRYVLRRKPPGKLLPSAHAVDREHRVITALAGTGVPVARTYALCEDESVIGTPFYIMECVDGRVLWDARLPGFSREERAAVFDEMNRVIAALHQVDYVAVGLADYGKPGSYFARQIARWTKQYKASQTETIEAMDRLAAWLPANTPAGDETTIVHGDFRLDNLIWSHTEPKIIAVLDWELSTLGHPLADFSYHCMMYHFPPDQFRGVLGAPLAELGIPCEEEYIAAYCQRTGRTSIPHWGFYIVYNAFRLAGILQGIMGRAVDGTAASPHAREMGQRARVIAELAWRRVEQLEAL